MTDRWLLVLRGPAEGRTVKVTAGVRYVRLNVIVPGPVPGQRPRAVLVVATYDTEDQADVLDVTAAVTGGMVAP